MQRRGYLTIGTLALFFWLAAAPAPAIPNSISTYDELVELFEEFREFQAAAPASGIPTYTPTAIADRHQHLGEFREKLAALDVANWPVWQQVDYHLVRAEMNAVEFHYSVYRPWARDPGFYSLLSGDAGASMTPQGLGFRLFEMSPPLSESESEKFRATLQAIPAIYEQAKINLTEAAGDLADFAIRNIGREVEVYDEFAAQLSEHHPDLAADAQEAGRSATQFIRWLADNRDAMMAPAALGKDSYSWWLRNVQLSPWGWEESNAIIEREYDRVITFLKLEENRNRNLPALPVAMTELEFETSLHYALQHVVEFLRDEEIMTVDDWVNPADYTSFETLGELRARIAAGGGGRGEDRAEDFLPENSSIDTKVRQREILPGETHEYIGHMLDEQREERLTKSPIRSAGRRFNMGSMRLEGWAVALEELLMQAGVLDERPRKGREMEYLMNASHMSLAIPDMKMQANEIDLAEARRLCAAIMPRGWSREDERMVWFEMQSNLRNPGGFHSNVVTGKAYFMKLFRERAQALGDDFVLRDFVDEFLSAGVIPMSLIRWEMSGDNGDVVLVTEELPGS
jgi:hypothetical protein